MRRVDMGGCRRLTASGVLEARGWGTRSRTSAEDKKGDTSIHDGVRYLLRETQCSDSHNLRLQGKYPGTRNLELYHIWEKNHNLEEWISERVLKLTCTSNDMILLAKAAGFKPLVHKWKTAERIELMAELDAAYFLLYGIKRDDVVYILSTFSSIQDKEETIFGPSSIYDQILKHYDNLKTKSKA